MACDVGYIDDGYGNCVPTSPCGPGQIEDSETGLCIMDYSGLDIQSTPFTPTLQCPPGGCPPDWPDDGYQEVYQDAQSECVAKGKYFCANGDCVHNQGDCGQLYKYDTDLGYTPEGEFIDVKGTEEDEGLRAIYDVIGGETWTDKSFEEWSDMYRDTFPTWEGSSYQAQSELIESQLAMLPHMMRLKEESFVLRADKAATETADTLTDIGSSREALIRTGGGLIKGETQEKIDTAYDRVLKGFDYGLDAIELEKEASLMDFENRRLDFDFDLQDIVQTFDEKMWELIRTNKQAMKAPNDGTGTVAGSLCPNKVNICEEQAEGGCFCPTEPNCEDYPCAE